MMWSHEVHEYRKWGNMWNKEIEGEWKQKKGEGGKGAQWKNKREYLMQQH